MLLQFIVECTKSQPAKVSEIYDNLADIIFLINCTCPKPNSTETRHPHVMLEMLLEIQEWEIYQPKGLVT